MNKLTKKRNEWGLSVAEMADKLSVTESTITMWEEQGNTPPIILNLVLPKIEDNG